MTRRFLFDAVVFDLDGTLIATDRFWIQAARAGARRAFAELGLERAMPSSEEWMGLVGHPLATGFARLFADLAPGERARVLELCQEEEHRSLAAGGAALMPGARETLATLRADGVKIGVASNCGRGYLAHMLHRSLLGELVDEGRCLDSPGVVSKADMIGDLLATFGTRSAVMVGDRAGDRDAAWENGIPHVHCAFGFAAREEEVRAEGVIEDLPELLELLAARRAGVEAALAAGGVLRASVAPPFVLGVGGPPAAGKSLFARDAARVLADHGFQVALVPLAEIFGRGAREGAGGVGQGAGRAERLAPSEQGDPLAALDLAALSERLLEPYAAGREVVLVTPAGELRVAPDDLLLLEGPRLLDPRLRARLDRVIWLETEDATILRRVAGRDARLVGPGPLAELRATLLPADREHASRYRPALLADAVLAADDPLRPRPLDAAELAAPAPALEQRG